MGLSMQWQGVHKGVVEVIVLAYGRGCQDCEVIIVDVDSLAKMGDGDVEGLEEVGWWWSRWICGGRRWQWLKTTENAVSAELAG